MNELKEFFITNPGIRLPRSKAGLFNMSDRQFRRAINDMRKSGMCIVSTSKNRGYIFMTKKDMDKTTAEIMLRENYSRIREIRNMIRPVEKLLQVNEQLTFTGV
jgi:hypothetical protein